METEIALSNGAIADPDDLSFRRNGVPSAPMRTNFATRAAKWRI